MMQHRARAVGVGLIGSRGGIWAERIKAEDGVESERLLDTGQMGRYRQKAAAMIMSSVTSNTALDTGPYGAGTVTGGRRGTERATQDADDADGNATTTVFAGAQKAEAQGNHAPRLQRSSLSRANGAAWPVLRSKARQAEERPSNGPRGLTGRAKRYLRRPHPGRATSLPLSTT